MNQNKDNFRKESHRTIRGLAKKSIELSRKMLHLSNQGVPRIEFLSIISRTLLDVTECDAIEIRTKHRDIQYRWEATKDEENPFSYEITSFIENDKGKAILCFKNDSGLEHLCRYIFLDKPDPSLPFFTRYGSFWTGNLNKGLTIPSGDNKKEQFYNIDIREKYLSLAMIPFLIDENNNGLLLLKSKKIDFFTLEEIEFYEVIAQNLGLAAADRRAQAALKERIKELTCLYNIAKTTEKTDLTLQESLNQIVMLLPPALQFPEIAHARIVLDNQTFETKNIKEEKNNLSADIIINKIKRGYVEVIYSEEKTDVEMSPFLVEEQSLIDAVARELSLFIERKQTHDERQKLQDQLRHADRLATIGQLAAGVAHELNEPLGSILGFSQLLLKTPGLTKQTQKDIQKIISASLYAREIVKNLMIFARQMPPQKSQVDLNQIVSNAIAFFESRCAKEGIELVYSLAEDLPAITADPAQITQVIINLAINAIQAMPEGGKLIITTAIKNNHVSLVVEDTGIGMNKEVMQQIFLPFFTTKDVNQGTGIGLAVVHGIVSSHGGTIEVDSIVHKGSRFEIELPISGKKMQKEKT